MAHRARAGYAFSGYIYILALCRAALAARGARARGPTASALLHATVHGAARIARVRSASPARASAAPASPTDALLIILFAPSTTTTTARYTLTMCHSLRVVAAVLLAAAPPPALSAASHCTWTKVEQPANGTFCSDHDHGTRIPAGQSPLAFGETTCLYHGGFFYGSDNGVRYVWCVETCPNGCGANMPQCEATYMRHCDGPPPTPPPAPPGPNTIGGLVLVPQGPRGAACLDGTAPGYWMEAATGTNASNWVIHAQGGGWW